MENHGKWHIDHIIPISLAKTEDEVYLLCHYTNFQPLWARDNLVKKNKLNENNRSNHSGDSGSDTTKRVSQ
jgi:hypothetical protein